MLAVRQVIAQVVRSQSAATVAILHLCLIVVSNIQLRKLFFLKERLIVLYIYFFIFLVYDDGGVKEFPKFFYECLYCPVWQYVCNLACGFRAGDVDVFKWLVDAAFFNVET